MTSQEMCRQLRQQAHPTRWNARGIRHEAPAANSHEARPAAAGCPSPTLEKVTTKLPAGSLPAGFIFPTKSPRWVQIALKPAAKGLGLHGVFICSKGLKDLIADSAFERMQVEVPGGVWLDADEHHRGVALRTGGALKWSRKNGGRQVLRLGHGCFPTNRREHKTLGHR